MCVAWLIHVRHAQLLAHTPMEMPMGWLWLVASIQLHVSFAEYSLFDRALLQKRPIISSILLSEATPYPSFICVTCLNRTRDMPHSYVWRDSYMADMLESFVQTPKEMGTIHSYVWCDASACVTCRIQMCDMPHPLMCVIRLIHGRHARVLSADARGDGHHMPGALRQRRRHGSGGHCHEDMLHCHEHMPHSIWTSAMAPSLLSTVSSLLNWPCEISVELTFGVLCTRSKNCAPSWRAAMLPAMVCV